MGIVRSLGPEARVKSITEKLETVYSIVMSLDILLQNFYRLVQYLLPT